MQKVISIQQAVVTIFVGPKLRKGKTKRIQSMLEWKRCRSAESLAGPSISPSHSSNDSAQKLVKVHDRFALAIYTVEQAEARIWWRLKNAVLVKGAAPFALREAEDRQEEDNEFEPPCLRQIYGFYEDVLHARSYRECKTLVVCTGRHPKDITINALLVGAFMILNDGMSLDQVNQVFDPIANQLVSFSDQLAVQDCWSALHHVTTHCGWLKLDARHRLRLCRDEEEAEPDTIDMAEYVHYDNPLNGNLHVLVPDKLLVFNRPADLPGGALWADADGERRFSAAYYADILCDFDVVVVVRACDEDAAAVDGDGYDAGAFVARGIEVEEVAGDDGDGGVPTLAEMDRFLAVARHAPGAVALHGGSAGLGAAGILIAAHLISAHRFRAKDAVAWVRMVHPAVLPAGHRGFLGLVEAHVRRRHLSMPSLMDACAAAAGGDGGRDGEVAGLAGLEAGLPRSVSAPRIFDFLDAHDAVAAAADAGGSGSSAGGDGSNGADVAAVRAAAACRVRSLP